MAPKKTEQNILEHQNHNSNNNDNKMNTNIETNIISL